MALTSFTNLSYMKGHLRWFTTVSPFRSETLVCARETQEGVESTYVPKEIPGECSTSFPNRAKKKLSCFEVSTKTN